MTPIDIIDNASTADYIYDFYSAMQQNNLVMVYEGDFTQEITKTVLNMTERSFELENIDSGVKKKVFNVMVEALQNICKHQYTATDATNDVSVKSAVFMIGYDIDNYYVITGNYILNTNTDKVSAKIDHINTLDQEGLKQLYKETRLTTTISDAGGAGLGLIDMARKSNNKIAYTFEKSNEMASFFTMMTIISTKKEE